MIEDDEKWVLLDIPNHPESKGLYEVSNKGNMRSISGKPKKCYVNDQGYVNTYIRSGEKGKIFKVHRLILQAFKPVSDWSKLEVNHINSARDDNRLENLEWCTRKENMQHALKNGRYADTKGVKNVRALLNDFDVLYIRDFYRRKIMKVSEIAKLFNIHDSSVYYILNYKTWKHVP